MVHFPGGESEKTHLRESGIEPATSATLVSSLEASKLATQTTRLGGIAPLRESFVQGDEINWEEVTKRVQNADKDRIFSDRTTYSLVSVEYRSCY